MSAGPFIPYHNGVLNNSLGNIDFVNDTMKAALLDNAHTPNAATHDAWDDVSADECADGDYAQITLSGQAITLDTGKVKFDANDIDFATGDNVDISARYLVVYKDTGTPATSYLFGYVDLNDGGSTNVSSTNADFSLEWSVNGIYRITP